jgi:hypothetical protein
MLGFSHRSCQLVGWAHAQRRTFVLEGLFEQHSGIPARARLSTTWTAQARTGSAHVYFHSMDLTVTDSGAPREWHYRFRC